MCIEVRVTYSHCIHVHLGYELCGEIDTAYECCSRLETHQRLDPFCPLCSKTEYRAYRLQSQWGSEAQQQQQPVAGTQSKAALRPRKRQSYARPQPKTLPECECSKQNAADYMTRASLDSPVSDLFSLSDVQAPNAYSSPPSPIEPPIHPALLGPHQFLEFRPTLAMVGVTDRRPRSDSYQEGAEIITLQRRTQT